MHLHCAQNLCSKRKKSTFNCLPTFFETIDDWWSHLFEIIDSHTYILPNQFWSMAWPFSEKKLLQSTTISSRHFACHAWFYFVLLGYTNKHVTSRPPGMLQNWSGRIEVWIFERDIFPIHPIYFMYIQVYSWPLIIGSTGKPRESRYLFSRYTLQMKFLWNIQNTSMILHLYLSSKKQTRKQNKSHFHYAFAHSNDTRWS